MRQGDFLGPIGNATPKYDASNPAVRYLLRRFPARGSDVEPGVEREALFRAAVSVGHQAVAVIRPVEPRGTVHSRRIHAVVASDLE